MAKLNYLKTDTDFKNFRQSKSYQSKFLKIRVHYSLSQNVPRFGFIVSKKTLAKATDRNLIKRRLKSSLQKVSDKIKGADILIFPQSAALKQKFEILNTELLDLISKAKLWK